VEYVHYEQAVSRYYEDVYRFAFSLAGSADQAGELTQETYCRLLARGGQLRDPAKIKSWLFTTLYRVFLGQRRHATRFPHLALEEAGADLPALTPDAVDKLDGATVMEALLEIEEHHRTPLTLFYLECLSYKEIAAVLEIPIGTIMSRLSRGKSALRERLAARLAFEQPVPLRSKPSPL